MSVVGVISSFMTVVGFSLEDIFCNIDWKLRLGILVLFYLTLFLIIVVLYICVMSKGISVKIRGITVKIKHGNIFFADGWRMIPCNGYYDTDDITIHSLNNQFLDKIKYNKHTSEKLNNVIRDKDRCNNKKAAKIEFPLGHIKTYEHGNDGYYMLLSFARFDAREKREHLSWSQYEECLKKMWCEISRTYIDKPVFLPLIGNGITRFTDRSEKPKPEELLHCILYTLCTSDIQLNKPITILLKKDLMQKMDIYNFRGIF